MNVTHKRYTPAGAESTSAPRLSAVSAATGRPRSESASRATAPCMGQSPSDETTLTSREPELSQGGPAVGPCASRRSTLPGGPCQDTIHPCTGGACPAADAQPRSNARLATAIARRCRGIIIAPPNDSRLSGRRPSGLAHNACTTSGQLASRINSQGRARATAAPSHAAPRWGEVRSRLRVCARALGCQTPSPSRAAREQFR